MYRYEILNKYGRYAHNLIFMPLCMRPLIYVCNEHMSCTHSIFLSILAIQNVRFSYKIFTCPNYWDVHEYLESSVMQLCNAFKYVCIKCISLSNNSLHVIYRRYPNMPSPLIHICFFPMRLSTFQTMTILHTHTHTHLNKREII